MLWPGTSVPGGTSTSTSCSATRTARCSSGSYATASTSAEVELQELDRVVARDLADRVVVEARDQLRHDRLRVGPARVRVRVVGLAGDVVDAHLVERREAVWVVDEAPRHVAVVVGRRRLGNVLRLGPALVVFPDLIDALERVRDPTDLTLGVHQLERG